MSAYICHDATFLAIAAYACLERPLGFSGARRYSGKNLTSYIPRLAARVLEDFPIKTGWWDTATPDDRVRYLADILKRENTRSVNYRYDDSETGNPVNRGLGIPTAAALSFWVSPVAAIKVISCWRYQSCETADHASTLAWEISEHSLQSAINWLPGYNDAPWGLDSFSQAA